MDNYIKVMPLNSVDNPKFLISQEDFDKFSNIEPHHALIAVTTIVMASKEVRRFYPLNRFRFGTRFYVYRPIMYGHGASGMVNVVCFLSVYDTNCIVQS